VDVIDAVAALTPVDDARIFVAGFSNGAMMAHQLACQAGDRVAAAAFVAGTPGIASLRASRAVRPVPVIAFHGTADRIIPYQGGPVSGLLPGRRRGRAASVADLKRFWLDANSCSGPPRLTTLPPGADGTWVVREAYTGAASADVDFYAIVVGGHTWPGGKQLLPRQVIGNTNRDINASELIWRFFAAHPLRATPALAVEEPFRACGG
jgi:polyhydroxybutyrate depolymerase